jgi:hypothetical protein
MEHLFKKAKKSEDPEEILYRTELLDGQRITKSPSFRIPNQENALTWKNWSDLL